MGKKAIKLQIKAHIWAEKASIKRYTRLEGETIIFVNLIMKILSACLKKSLFQIAGYSG